MGNTALFLLEFISQHPGVWSDRQLADELALSESNVKKSLMALRHEGKISTRTERHHLRGRWWARRTVEVVKELN